MSVVTKSIAYRRGDGGLSICHPVISMNDPEGFLEQEAIDRALANDIPGDATEIKVVDRDSIPPARSEREAWFAGL